MAGEVREFVEERVGQRLAGLGAVVSEVRVLVGEEVKEVFAERVAAELAAYVERQAAIDEAIAEKRDGQSAELSALRASGGTAIAVSDEELIAATREIGTVEGIFCAPEGAACLPALKKLIEAGEVHKRERVVLFNTGAGVKYMESFANAG